MGNLNQELLSYLQNNIADYEHFINDYTLEYLYNDVIENVDMELYKSNMIKILGQEQKSELIYEEIQQIAQKFKDNGVKLVHLKGVVLVKDLYQGEFQKRKVHDIDFLVSYHDASKAMSLLSGMGYGYYNGEKNITEESIENNISQVIDRRIHLPVLEKRKAYNGKIYKIFIDLHIALNHSGENKAEFADEAVNRAIPIDCDGTTMYILEPNDQVLFLVQHITKEFFRNDVRWLITGSKKVEVDSRFDLHLLHDIALLIQKYKDKLDWNTIIDRTKSASSYNDLILITKLIRIIYPTMREVIPEYNYADTDNLDKKIGRFYAFKYVMGSEEEFLFHNIEDYAKKIMKTALENSSTIDTDKEYYLKHVNTENYFGFRLSETNQDAWLKVKFDLKDNGICICINNYADISSLAVVIGSDYKHKKLSSYINKYLITIENDEIFIEARNRYAIEKIDNVTRINQNEFSFLIPFDFLAANIDKVLVEITLADYDDSENKVSCLHKDKYDRGTYAFSPELLYCLRTKP